MGVHKKKSLLVVQCELTSTDKDGNEVKLRIDMMSENTEISKTTWQLLGNSGTTGEAGLKMIKPQCSKPIPLSRKCYAKFIREYLLFFKDRFTNCNHRKPRGFVVVLQTLIASFNYN